MAIFCEGQTVLFQGDSITDAGRDRNDSAHMGYGYALMASAWYAAACPQKKIRFLNRGISGNRVPDLLGRFDLDFVALKPDWVSILIGINDTWRAFDSGDPTGTDVYEKGYRELLEKLVAATGARLILCEPFLLPVRPDQASWRPDLDPKIQAVRRLAREFSALYVPFDGIFAQAATQREPAFWAGDGVHPSNAGHALMARAWLKTIGMCV